MGSPVTVKGLIARFLPSPFIDDREDDKPIRLKRYGEQNISEASANDFGYCEEGSFMLATNAAVGTGVTWVTVQTAFSDTAPNIYLFNTENGSNTNAKSLWIRYIKLVATATATAATSVQYAVIMDNLSRSFTTDNTTTIVPVSTNGNVSTSSTPLIKVQNSATASAIAASSLNKRIVARGALGGLPIIGSELYLAFGTTDAGGAGPMTAAAAAAGRSVSSASPIIIPPQWSVTVHIWMPSSSASLNPEFEIGVVLR